MSTAEQSFKAGDLSQALASLQSEVKQRPADVKLRVFLAQLLMIQGQWERALNQLKVVEELDAGTLPMVRTYQTTIQCERFRADVFNGKRSPLLFGDPEPWTALLIQALTVQVSQAEDLRAQAFELAPETSGTLNGERFAWIADADTRLGPVFEVLLNGSYYWVPIHRIARVAIETPQDARDLVWLPAQFTWVNGGEALGFIPTRYPSSEASDDPMIQLARKTVWQQLGEATYVGQGQRLLATDVNENGLLDVRELIFDTPVSAAAE